MFRFFPHFSHVLFSFLTLILEAAESRKEKYMEDVALIFKAIHSSLINIGEKQWQSRVSPKDIEVITFIFWAWITSYAFIPTFKMFAEDNEHHQQVAGFHWKLRCFSFAWGYLHSHRKIFSSSFQEEFWCKLRVHLKRHWRKHPLIGFSSWAATHECKIDVKSLSSTELTDWKPDLLCILIAAS